jgi:hypothetical protein
MYEPLLKDDSHGSFDCKKLISTEKKNFNLFYPGGKRPSGLEGIWETDANIMSRERDSSYKYPPRGGLSIQCTESQIYSRDWMRQKTKDRPPTITMSGGSFLTVFRGTYFTIILAIIWEVFVYPRFSHIEEPVDPLEVCLLTNGSDSAAVAKGFDLPLDGSVVWYSTDRHYYLRDMYVSLRGLCD